ncbi:hypothetical protein [Actinoplanes subglobosus]|uniref:NAD(P)-binding domain-containing protein n=1 Tax=Actinoplanes subglobosus TaxID=1547892 RepID=A0ABV8J5U2_9ACTN
MARIVEYSPVLATARHTDGIWNAHVATRRLALERGHDHHRPAGGPAPETIRGADALILAPVPARPALRLPSDDHRAGRPAAHRILDRIRGQRPDLHIVLVSHFLVGRGLTRRDDKPYTWGLRALEGRLRDGPNPWTILRPAWLSGRDDPFHQVCFTQDVRADGLVTTDGIARAVLAAIEHPRAAAGRTATVFNLSIPGAAPADLPGQLRALEPDLEATTPWLQAFA